MNNLILSSTPLRISFIGGGTDFREFYCKNNTYGQVISAAINLRTYCILKKKIKTKIKSDQKLFNNEIYNTNIYKSFSKFTKEQKVYDKYDVIFYSDIPNGSGLGTSSSFILSLLKCFFKSIEKNVTNKELINFSNYFESSLMKRPIGMQDAWGSQISGIKKIRFYKNRVDIKKIHKSKFTNFVNNNLFLYPINSFKSNKNILNNIRKNIISNSTTNLLMQMNELSNRAYKTILNDDFKSFLSILRDSHDIKSSYTKGVSNNTIEKSFSYLKSREVMPLKILGAGGRGFILFFCDKKNKLINNNINYLDFKVV